MRRTKEEAEHTRSQILQAAERLFMAKGVAHTSLEQIARAAGVTRGAIYWHFENKAHLFNAMLNQIRLPPEVMAERVSGVDGQDPLRGLYALCLEALVSLQDDEQKRRILTILMQRCEFTDELREAEDRHNQFVDQFIQLCQSLFERQPERLYPGITPTQAARSLHGMVVGLVHDWLRQPWSFDMELNAPVYLDALFRGLLREWQPAGGGKA